GPRPRACRSARGRRAAKASFTAGGAASTAPAIASSIAIPTLNIAYEPRCGYPHGAVRRSRDDRADRHQPRRGQMAVADAKGREFDAATGIAFAVVAVVGLALPGTPPKAKDSAEKIISFAAQHRSDILWSSFLVGSAAVLFLWFLGSLRSYLRAGEGGEGRLSAAAFG